MIGCHIFARITDKFVEKHLVVSDHLIEELQSLNFKKPIEVRKNPVNYSEKLEKKSHRGFNVLYYRPETKNMPFTNWVYGYDIMQKLKSKMPEINVIEVNGNSDMNEVFPIIDFYARPNRHDGCPRLIRECELQDISYYHSFNNPSFKKLKNEIQKITRKNSEIRIT